MGLMMLIVAVILFWLISPIAFLLTILNPFSWNKGYFKRIAVSIDQLGNVMCAYLFNFILIKYDGYQFGNEDDTISRVLGVNKKIDKLTKIGKFVATILNKIEPNHVEKAV